MISTNYTHRQRIERCLSGDAADRPPVALWRHFPVDDQQPDTLAAAVANFQRTFDFDFIKLTPSSSYSVSGWGTQDVWEGNPEGTRRYTRTAIHQPEDWASLALLDPSQGSLADARQALQLLLEEFSPHTPVIQTIFSPLSQAKNLVGKENLLAHLRRSPDSLHAGLEIITQNTLRLIESLQKTNLDGIFYAVQHAQFGVLSPQEFEDFCRPYDLRILDACKNLWLNVLHVHGTDVMFDQVADYPVQVMNWHDRQTPPSLPAGKERFAGAVCGGLRQWETMLLGTPEDVLSEAQDAIAATGGTRFILGTGCVLPIAAPYGNIRAARMAVEKTGEKS